MLIAVRRLPGNARINRLLEPRSPRRPHMVDQIPSVALALQGGGSHGAFTWGVLDRLLQEVASQPPALRRHQRHQRRSLQRCPHRQRPHPGRPQISPGASWRISGARYLPCRLPRRQSSSSSVNPGRSASTSTGRLWRSRWKPSASSSRHTPIHSTATRSHH